MKLYFEEYPYPVDLLHENLGNEVNLSYLQGGSLAKVPYVGYYFNSNINDTVFILPKVFISESQQAFDRYNPIEIIDLSPYDNPLKAKADDEVVFELSAWLYQAINHFVERKQRSNISSEVQIQNIKPMGEKGSKTIIETILSLVGFQKKHCNLFTYISLVKSSGNNKVHWNKTISKVQPVFKDDRPYYMDFRNKRKVINFDEELIILFYSVLNYLSLTYHFKLQLVQGFALLRPSRIKSLIESGKGTRILKKIRRNYFTDELVELWNLLYAFFDKAEMVGSGKPYQEKLLVSNFNLVFEDMIDQLISDDRHNVPKELWEQQDGKIVDHIYKDSSVIDDDKFIYYIGDSKYYKEETSLSENSIYKQFTYAKNVIQYNINLFNHEDNPPKDVRYRDPLTEGYNITPNFFIRGFIDFNDPNSQEQKLTKNAEFERNIHFFNRLFDRDSLFLQSYNINFMFVVASYVNNTEEVALKKSLQAMLRRDFITFIESRFEFSVLEPREDSVPIQDLVEKYFKRLNGKIYQPSEGGNLLILALDKDNRYQFDNLQLLSQIETDFHIYDYRLGTDFHETKKPIPFQYLDTPVSVAAEKRVSTDKVEELPTQQSQYRQYRQASILFGVYKDPEHLDWILKNKKYNVRLGERAGAVKRTRQVVSAEYLVLYELKNETNYLVFRLSDKHFIWNNQKMKEMGYAISEEDEKRQYYIYTLADRIDLGDIDIAGVLNRKKAEFEKDTGETMEEGTPIYVFENEFQVGRWETKPTVARL